jgi:hypothetical protein
MKDKFVKANVAIKCKGILATEDILVDLIRIEFNDVLSKSFLKKMDDNFSYSLYKKLFHNDKIIFINQPDPNALLIPLDSVIFSQEKDCIMITVSEKIEPDLIKLKCLSYVKISSFFCSLILTKDAYEQFKDTGLLSIADSKPLPIPPEWICHDQFL